MRNPRAQFFFWLGVFVLPIFWSWFTLSKAFSRGQRLAALSWLVIYSAVGAWQWQTLSTYFNLLPFGYPLISLWLTLALWIWLLARVFYDAFRKVKVWQFIGGCIVGCDMLAQPLNLAQSVTNVLIWKAGPFSMECVWFPLLLATAHCLLDSIKRGLARLLGLRLAI